MRRGRERCKIVPDVVARPAETVFMPVIASGVGGTVGHIRKGLIAGGATAALAALIFHSRESPSSSASSPSPSTAFRFRYSRTVEPAS